MVFGSYWVIAAELKWAGECGIVKRNPGEVCSVNKLVGWSIAAAVLMLGGPFCSVVFGGDTGGMGTFIFLFFVLDPLFSVVCGIVAGRQIKELWMLPLITAGLFVAGTWLFFELGEPAFLLYGGCYLLIGTVVMLISAFVTKRCKKCD